MLELRLKAGADILPQEVVFLTHLGVANAQRVLVSDAGEDPADELGVTAGEPGRLQGVDTLEAIPGIGLEIIDRIRAQQTEHGDLQLVLFRLGGDENILFAGEVHTVGVAAPEGKAVGTQLVTADTGTNQAVLFRGIADGHVIQNPGADGLGVFPENRVEIRHIGIHQFLPVFRRITQGVGAVHPVIVLFFLAAVPEGDAGPAAQLAGDLPPGGNFVVLVQIIQQQSLISRVDQCVMFQCVCTRQTVLLHQDQLVADGLKIIGDEFAGVLMGLADKVINIDDGCLLHECSPPVR